MGRNKNRNKLQLKSPSQLRNESFSNNNSFNDSEMYDDENNFESSENILNNPILLNHINEIQNINESVLLWSNEDVIDENRSKSFHSIVKHEIIKKSIKKSAFSKYLKSQLKDINTIHLSAISGVLMKNEMESDKSSVILNEIPNNNYLTIETKKQSVDNKNAFELPEEIENVDANRQQVSMKEACVNPDEPAVRRSGRSAKINYKDMLNVHIYEPIRQMDDWHSPKRKHKLKREPSRPSMRQSTNDNSETDNRSLEPKVTDQKVEFSELGSEKQDGKCTIEHEVPPENAIMRKEEEKPSQYVLEEESQQLQKADDNIIHEPRQQQLEDNKSNGKRKAFRKPTKDPSRNCIMCSKAVMGSRKFDNLCYNCVVASTKIITRLKLSSNNILSIVCLGDLGCWERIMDTTDRTDSLPCDACRIQQLMAAGLQWGEQLQWMRTVTLDELRSHQAVKESRQLQWDEGQAWLDQFTKVEHCGSCLLPDTEWTQTYKWDIRYLLPLDTDDMTQCQFCTSPHDSNIERSAVSGRLYTFLPLKEATICHHCLLIAHHAVKNSEQPADGLVQQIQPICPLEALRYRYFDGASNPESLCEICMRRDRSVMSRLRSGNLVCLMCIWRIKRVHFCPSYDHIDPDADDDNDGNGNQKSSCHHHLDQWLLCPINQCDKCLKQLAIRVIELHQIITHYHNPNTINSTIKFQLSAHKKPSNTETTESNRKPKKRTIEDCEDVTEESNPKRHCTDISNPLEIDANLTPIQISSGGQRPRRVIKATRFNDFIVDDKCLLRSTNERSVKRKSGLLGHDIGHIPAQISPGKSSDSKSLLSTGENEQHKLDSPDQLAHADEVDKEEGHSIIDGVVVSLSCENVGIADSIVAGGSDSVGNGNQEIICDSAPIIADAPQGELIEQHPAVNTDDCTTRRPPPFRRIKQAICSQTSKPAEVVNEEEIINQVEESTTCVHQQQPTIIAQQPARATNGPRVKQVSRQNVNVDSNIDLTRQKCVVKRANRIIRKPENLTNFIIDDHSITDQMEDEEEDHHLDQISSGRCDSIPLDRHSAFGLDGNRCGVCAGCCRNRSCGKCDPCLLNKSQRRKTELCVKMICTARTHTTNQMNHIGSNRDKISDIRNDPEMNALNEVSTTDKSVDEITPGPDVSVVCQQPCNGIDVYRDSDSDDLSSEEEQLDPELDSIHTVKGDLITTGLAHDGGFPVITTVNAQPNKVLCYSCGSGGDQLIHCVSCAEPFHFFCIEYQFRPKSKEMFVCRNCTRCHSCDGYGSDLKCIKCQLGFHPSCVDKYPPTRSDDKSNWACYKCAMCLHCGAKAEDAMTHHNTSKFNGEIDWSKDPWQCGRCARARINGHVCPECGRAYQAGLETIECNSCNRMVHRQCCGLSEDEYEIFKADPEAHCSSNAFLCTKCQPPNVVEEAEQKKRVRLKRQCKDSGLKQYCERSVQRKMNEFVQKGEAVEEMLLEQHNISDSTVSTAAGAGYNRSSMSISQFDGHGDEDDEDNEGKAGADGGLMPVKDYEGPTMNSPFADMNQTNSTMFCSSESTGECDMEPLSLMDLEHQSGKVDIDVELENVALEPSRATKIGIFSRLNAPDFLSPKHLLMEALARIFVKLSRYPSHSQLHKIYDRFIGRIKDLTGEIFPWIDFHITMETVQVVVKKYSGRAKLILQALTENVRDNINREFDVFSSSITEIEEKLSNSFQRGREEFIIFHSEQHLSGLMKSMESRYSGDNTNAATYNLAFTSEFNSAIFEKDIRHCALCAGSGDDRLEGRLIYGGLDVWVHVNCALWSDDVYEREDGALVNVDIAIRQGEKSLCTVCQKYGATLRCSAVESFGDNGGSCPNVYHFACAFNMLPDPVFTELRTFYCSESHESCVTDVQQLTLVDMPILRRIYLPQGCLANVSMACTDGVASDNIVVTIGNLRINCMGKIDECSDYLRVYLCPIGYKARRLFWSMHELDSLVMYYMNITKELNNKANGDEISASASGVANQHPLTAIAVAAIPHRRRMIEMPEQRAMKRPKPMQCRQDIIYEMDDAGNLQPISGFFRQQQQVSTTLSNQISTNDIAAKKVNRRFPISITNSCVGIAQKSSKNSLPGADEKCRIVSLGRPENINRNSNINNCSSIIIKSHPISQPSQQLHQPRQQQSQQQSQSPIILKQQDPPVMLRFSQIPIQPQRLPPSIIKQLNINRNQSKPLTFINLAQPINRISGRNTQINNKIYKVMKVSAPTGNSPPISVSNSSTSRCIPVSQLTATNKHPSLRIVTSRPPLSSSVLRTVLTDNSHCRRVVVQHQPVPTGTTRSSEYHISSCGSIVTQSLAQFDGEADDGEAVTFDEFRSILTANPVQNGGSDQENASVITMATTAVSSRTRKPRANHDYKFCLRFTIHGFKGSKSPKSGWGLIVKRVTQMRKTQGLAEYPVRNGDGWAKFGLDHRHVIYLVEQMVNAFQCNNYEFKFHKTRATKLRNQYLADVVSPHGCIRFTQWTKTKPDHIARDPLAFLHSKSNYPPKNHAPLNADQLDDNPDPGEDYLSTLADQFRNLHNGIDARAKTVRVCVSNIHGRGLFARRQFNAHEIIIEYVGEVIRSILSDVRETEYQRTGVDCYMFRLDQDFIVDATFKGNAARFINHSCHPNCYAKVVRFEGEKHIIIIAQRKIYKGEELTYDYRFPIEDDKLPCTCGSFSCKKYLN